MKIVNRRARHDYRIFESFEAGIALSGPEVKSIKQGRGDLSSSFVRIKDGQAWLVGANIPLYELAHSREHDPLRERKLLLHKKELVSLALRLARGLTLIPLSLYTKGRLIKAEIALAQGKKKYEKKEVKKKRDIEREIERAMKAH